MVKVVPFRPPVARNGSGTGTPADSRRLSAHVFTLRSLADSRAIIERAGAAQSAVVLGSGFIGWKWQPALRARGLEGHVVSLDERPLEKELGPDLGAFIRGLHERHG